ncbi:uncharacterized protein LOC112521562 isoform X1 [Cynara cardunculus var. scolymus]|uniref:uncharacterized protein LOC112521562 isoform X1 n=1 Tax=Cynara cardunculus var. scolymus TaxID=59895 RepID=UPI000D628319|nr:uncharacterized protein LOC112521562 isoform X1 [Cynara cardunculus var. scolymus]XP_024986254.1 uncharacterized protein LOC112521562 isoform X1 [Cynara cardunculus var. scolymus]XP_024986257.1 uncharacterized protein LOC112521562 isoform X1 [Cynara cardunculus var. scolymus]XP_024986258.1 uncharacterized protein LOC112521562 isoform X1 [Cynara cardunculus var. scolymus]
MHFHAHTFTCSTSYPTKYYLTKAAVFKTLASAKKPLYDYGTGVSFRHTGSRGFPLGLKQMNRRGLMNSASEGQSTSNSAEKKREVVEHICLLKAKVDLSDEDEKDMLDFLYTCQYQMRGILAISLGRISYQNLESYTHAVFMRFQKREDLAKFYENPFYLGVLKDHVTPYCHEFTYVDYESEVEDDILPIFRKGEEFNFGVEFLLLIAFKESSLEEAADDALTSFTKLLMEFPSLIVQATKGLNFNPGSKDYTHAVVIRFRSCEPLFQLYDSQTIYFCFFSQLTTRSWSSIADAYDIFMGSSEYKEIWRSKFQPITEKKLSISFSVDPVGNELM